MERQKTGTFGARILHEKEIELSLPTYKKLKSQIEDVRTNSKNYKNEIKGNKKDEFTYSQVINNFAILGERGTGKSSILKTLYQDLKNENESDKELNKIKNIMLPPIVPENLVSHISLMGCLLGLLKEPVRQICQNQENKKTLCPPEKHNIEKLYKSLVEDFVRLQKPYEQISVREFSTDSEYVRTMTSIYEAGNQFAIKFREFIDELLAQYNNEAMLFIFIDDIDLSTTRCGDIVKTLLSYLSHPSIVTVLAGDIAVFGEALTIEFVRQEEITDAEFMRRSYLIESVDKKTSTGEDDKDNLLKRKKQLAYEYLKKVMPPNNRHHILYWTLSMRGDFCCIDTQKSGDKNEEYVTKSVNLTYLLVKLDKKVPLLNYYFSGKDKNNENQDRKSDALLYHFFDHTARGLIGSYNAINQLIKNCENDKLPEYQDIKFVIESIVSSNYILSQYKDIIFSQFIEFGIDIESTRVNFDNFSEWIKKTLSYLRIYGLIDVLEFKDDKSNENQNIEVDIEEERKVFQIFVFLDWATRLLGKEKIIDNDKQYNNIKKQMLFLICYNGYINEKNMCLNTKEGKKIYPHKQSNNHINRHDSNEYIHTILRTYYNLPFPIAVRYFQTFDIKMLLQLLENKGEEKQQKYIKFAMDFVETIKGFYSGYNEKFAECIEKNEDMYSFVEDILNRDERNTLLSILSNEYFREESQFYRHYCLSGIDKIYVWNKQNDDKSSDKLFNVVINNFDFTSDDYIRSIYRTNNITEEIKEYIFNGQNIIEEKKEDYSNLSKRCCNEWLKLFDKSENTNNARPFLNAYINYMENYIFEKNYIKNLKEGYKDNILYEENREQIDIIYAIDEKGLWNIDTDIASEEKYIENIVKYIKDKMKNLEDIIISKFRDVNENKILIEISPDLKNAFQKFKKSSDGIGYTLAWKCKKYLQKIWDKDCGKKSISTIEYIAANIILNRLIYSTAWYGIVEAREVRNELQKCKCDIFENMDTEEFKKLTLEYIFWFHCYCRYKISKNTKTYELSQKSTEIINNVEESISKYDKSREDMYVENFANQLEIPEETVIKIPQLFAIKENNEDENNA